LFNGDLNAKKIKPYMPEEPVKRTHTAINELQQILEQRERERKK